MFETLGCFNSVFCCFGYRLYTIFVSCWFHFGIMLVSFWCPWVSFGDPGAPRAPLKGQRRKSDEKVGSLAAFWPPLGVPLGSNFRYFCVFSVFFLAIFSKRFLEGFWGLRGPPPTMKIMVSCKRNHYFHISTCTSQKIKMASNGYPFGIPLGGFESC